MTVVHLFHDDPDSLLIGSRLPRRMAEAARPDDPPLEVFVFGAAQRRLGRADTDLDRRFTEQIDELFTAGIPVSACVTLARADGLEDALRARGLSLVIARDAFLRYAREGATVISF